MRNALRESCASRRVEDQTNVLRRRLIGSIRNAVVTVDNVVKAKCAGWQLGVYRDDCCNGQFIQFALDKLKARLITDQHFRTTIIYGIAKFFGLTPAIDGYGYSTDYHGCQECNTPFRPVAHRDGDAVALSDIIFTLQRRSECVYLLEKFIEGIALAFINQKFNVSVSSPGLHGGQQIWRRMPERLIALSRQFHVHKFEELAVSDYFTNFGLNIGGGNTHWLCLWLVRDRVHGSTACAHGATSCAAARSLTAQEYSSQPTAVTWV